MLLRRSDRGAIGVVGGVVLVVLTLAGAGAAWWAVSNSNSSNPQGITLEITGARGARDVNGVPFAIIDFKIDYQSDITAQAQASVPEVRCEITQKQMTQTRQFVGGTVAPGTSRIVTGTVTIAPGADNRSIGGEYTLRCQLIRDETTLLATDKGPTIDVPRVDDQPADLSYTGRYTIAPPAGSQCRGGETYDFTYTVRVDEQLNPHKFGTFTNVNYGASVEVPLGDDMSFSFTVPAVVENPLFGGTVTGGFVTEIDKVRMVGTVQLRGTVDPDCDYQFSAPRQ